MKRMLQAFWLLGSGGLLFIMATQDSPVPVFVAEHPQYIWLVGPLFAALTGERAGLVKCCVTWSALSSLTRW
jgi:uncharacterized integral membrane protein